MKKKAKGAAAKKAKKNVATITPLSKKLVLELKKDKEFKNKNQVIEAAISFFYIWKKLPDEFRKLNEMKNNELQLNSQLEQIEKVTSEVLLKLPIKDKK